MEYKQFKDELYRKVSEEFKDYEVMLCVLNKEYKKVDAISVAFNENVHPTIFLDDCYGIYERTNDIQAITDDVVKVLVDAKDNFIDNILDKIRAGIYISASNGILAKKMDDVVFTEDVPICNEIKGICFVYKFIFKDHESKYNGIITNELMKELGFENKNELYKYALTNSLLIKRDVNIESVFTVNQGKDKISIYKYGYNSPGDASGALIFDEYLKDFSSKELKNDIYVYPISTEEVFFSSVRLTYDNFKEVTESICNRMSARPLSNDIYVLHQEKFMTYDNYRVKMEALQDVSKKVKKKCR